MNIEEKINAANQRVIDAYLNGQPTWVDIQPAIKVIPEMKTNMLLVAGPPIALGDMVEPMKNSICGAAIHEGLAKTKEEAWQMALAGELEVHSAQDYGCADGSAMTTSASTPVIVAKDMENGTYGFSALHPGMKAKVLRWGCYDEEVEQDLAWIRDTYAPALGEAIRNIGGINCRIILAKTAGMGDENHNRQYASSMALAIELVPALLDLKIPERDQVIKEYLKNERFFLHVMMAGCCSVIAACKNVPYSTVMVGMGGNGKQFGLQFSGTGNEWFCADAPKITSFFLNPKTTADDLVGYLGDSCITEVYGLGGVSVISAPGFAQMMGAGLEEARKRTEDARAVSLGEHMFAPVPWDNGRGFPVGIDMRRVVGLNILPTSNGGGVLKTGGQGSSGAVKLPMECFKKGLTAFNSKGRNGI